MSIRPRAMWAAVCVVLVAVTGAVGACAPGTDEVVQVIDTSPKPTSPEPGSTEFMVDCIPVLRFRWDGIEYENDRFQDVVAESDLAEVIGSVERNPVALMTCEPTTLADGDGTIAVGTEIRSIIGVDRAEAVAAVVAGTARRFVAVSP
jgi:hypothetical protein